MGQSFELNLVVYPEADSVPSAVCAAGKAHRFRSWHRGILRPDQAECLWDGLGVSKDALERQRWQS